MTDITFKNTNVLSVDEFFTKVKDILDSFAKLKEPLIEKKDEFLESTGFFEVPGASNFYTTLTYS